MMIRINALVFWFSYSEFICVQANIRQNIIAFHMYSPGGNVWPIRSMCFIDGNFIELSEMDIIGINFYRFALQFLRVWAVEGARWETYGLGPTFHPSLYLWWILIFGFDFVLFFSSGIDICFRKAFRCLTLGSVFSGPSPGKPVEWLLIDGCLDDAFCSHRRAEQSIDFQSRGAEFQRWVVKSMMWLDPCDQCDGVIRLIWPLTSSQPVPLFLGLVDKMWWMPFELLC